jgi:uncharacterized membrane protein (DUF373 family)
VEGSPETPPRRARRAPARDSDVIELGIAGAETAIYVVAAALLVAAAAFTVVGTIVDLIEGSDKRPIGDSGVFVLDRVLLLFIIAELLYTLRAVNLGGRILVEPFLLIGMIAVVRKVLIIAAEAQQRELTVNDLVLEIAALAGLALVLALSIHLLRRPGRPAG